MTARPAPWGAWCRYFFLQPALAAAGIAVVALAWWVHGRVRV
jgi:hypothetical protein